jgi:hypothetical protein
MAIVKKGGVPTRLFTRTTDEMIRIDLSLPQHASLISIGREEHETTNENLNHHHLANGAFRCHLLNSAQYDGGAFAVSEVKEVPRSQPINSVGGSSGSFLCNIWEAQTP